jgi:hypothetical protein
MSDARRMTELAASFHELRGVAGTDPWKPSALDAWAASGAPGHGALCASE